MRELERSRRDADAGRGGAASTSGASRGVTPRAVSAPTPTGAGAGEDARRGSVGSPTPAPARGVFAPSDLLPSRAAYGGAVGVVRQRHPDIDEVTRETTRVGDVLLKHEARDIETLNAYAAAVEAEESNAYAGALTPPCAAEAANVRACYSTHAQDTTECRKFVDAYKKCGRVALRSFVSPSNRA